MILANNRSIKLGTLICSAHARTVRPTGADRPDRGPSGLRAGPSALNLVLNRSGLILLQVGEDEDDLNSIVSVENLPPAAAHGMSSLAVSGVVYTDDKKNHYTNVGTPRESDRASS
jgi:hypothetical protein